MVLNALPEIPSNLAGDDTLYGIPFQLPSLTPERQGSQKYCLMLGKKVSIFSFSF